VMARLGGGIRASSAPLRGTVFTLVFPFARVPQRPERVMAPPRPHRVLLIDDEADNLEVLRELLQLEGQDVETAQSGPSALNLFRKGEEFDLVLCDVGMPEMSGWQVAREIQELAHGTPVYMLTGWANEIGAKDARRDLVRGVLAKPLDLDILRELLARPREEREAASLTH
jgi:CheY-like chemotaxis protein